MTCPTSHLGVPKHQALVLCDFRQGPSPVCALAPTRWLLGKYEGQHGPRPLGAELVQRPRSEGEPVSPRPVQSL